MPFAIALLWLLFEVSNDRYWRLTMWTTENINIAVRMFALITIVITSL